MVEKKARRFLGALLLVTFTAVAGIAGTPGTAGAHASVASTSPTDGEILEDRPGSVVIEFNEKVNVSENSVRLVDSAGEQRSLVENGRNEVGAGVEITWVVPDDLEEGWHAVAWRAVSEDGHPINGSFTFYYGDPGAAGSSAKAENAADPTRPFIILSDALRALTYLSVLLAVGLMLATWATGGALTTAALPGLAAKTRRWSAVAAVAGLVVTPAALVNSSVLLNGGSTESLGIIIQIVLQSSAGAALLVRMSALFGVCTAILLIAEQGTKKIGAAVGVISAGALMYSFPMAGHASVVPWTWPAKIAESVHLLAGAAWLGAIPAVAIVVARRRELTREATIETVERFSKIATVSVIAVLIAGLTLSVTMFASAEEIILTRYGVTLLVKFTLVGLIALAGAYNHFHLLPTMRRGREEDWPRQRLHLKSTLLGEAAGLLLVIAATTALTMVSAPAAGGSHFAGGGHGHGGFGDGTELEIALSDLEPKILQTPLGTGEARLDYLPGRADAENRFTVTVTDENGNERSLEKVKVEFTNEALEIGPITRNFESDNGTWRLVGRDLGVAGTWTAKITFTFADQQLDTAEFSVDIAAPLGSTQP
jgi:copper transport protein